MFDDEASEEDEEDAEALERERKKQQREEENESEELKEQRRNMEQRLLERQKQRMLIRMSRLKIKLTISKHATLSSEGKKDFGEKLAKSPTCNCNVDSIYLRLKTQSCLRLSA